MRRIAAYDVLPPQVVAIRHVQPQTEQRGDGPHGEQTACKADQDSVEPVELPVQPICSALQILRRHPGRPDHHVSEVVMRKVLICDAPLAQHVCMQGRSRQRRKDIQLKTVYPGALQKTQRSFENIYIIVIQADNHSRHDSDSSTADAPDVLKIMRAVIKSFLHQRQVLFAGGLNADEKSPATGPPRKRKQLRVVGNLDRALADPALLQGNHGAE